MKIWLHLDTIRVAIAVAIVSVLLDTDPDSDTDPGGSLFADIFATVCHAPWGAPGDA